MNRNVVNLFCALVLLVAGCGSEKAIDFEQLVERDGIYYENNSEVGFTGWAVTTYENGQKKYEGAFKDGKRNGEDTGWYENGQKKYEGTCKNGEWVGKRTAWYENGQKKYEGTSKNGEMEGKHSQWYENGQKQVESTWKDGKMIESTTWDENGRALPIPY